MNMEERFIAALVKFNSIEVAGLAKILGVKLGNVDGDNVIARDGLDILCDIVDAWKSSKRRPRRELLRCAEQIARDHDRTDSVLRSEVEDGTVAADKQD